MSNTTTYYSLYQPEVGDGSANAAPWGIAMNSNLDVIDTALHNHQTSLEDHESRIGVLEDAGTTHAVTYQVGFYWETALLTTDKQPVWLANFVGRFSVVKYYRDNTGGAGTGQILIKKNGTTVYTIDPTSASNQTLVTAVTSDVDFVVGDLFTAVVNTAGTVANLSLFMLGTRSV